MSDHATPGAPEMIALARLTPDEQFQPRDAGLAESHVRLLMESDPAMWLPLTVAPDGDGFVIIDGFHRREAAQRLGLASLSCVVVPGAGYEDAVAANIRHGLPLSIADRKEAARWWAEQEPELSLREIGRRTGLSDKTVKRAIDSTSVVPPQPRPAPDPLDRWLLTTARLDRRPSARDIGREIASYDPADRSDIAKGYAAVGKALVEAATPYLERR